MSYAVLMVFVELDGTAKPRVRVAASLADKFGATLIGLSACAIPIPIPAHGMVTQAPTAMDINLIEERLAKQGDWFRSIADGDRRKVEWRSALYFPNEVIASEARSADLIVIGQIKGPRSTYSALDLGAAILNMGRPTLVVPEGVTSLAAEHVVVGWKDTREARRAVRDALPFLRRPRGLRFLRRVDPRRRKRRWRASTMWPVTLHCIGSRAVRWSWCRNRVRVPPSCSRSLRMNGLIC
jgi:hypothetical protein